MPDMLTDLVTAALDFAVLTAPVDHPLLETAPFFRDPLVCIAPKAELQKPLPIHPKDFADRRLMLLGLAACFAGISMIGWLPIVDVESAGPKEFCRGRIRWGHRLRDRSQRAGREGPLQHRAS